LNEKQHCSVATKAATLLREKQAWRGGAPRAGTVSRVRLGANAKRIKSELREELTPIERAFWYVWVALIFVLPPLAIGLLLLGGSGGRAVGIGLLIAMLLVYAAPVARILRARVRRREAGARTSD
jgi:hypothetical protein